MTSTNNDENKFPPPQKQVFESKQMEEDLKAILLKDNAEQFQKLLSSFSIFQKKVIHNLKIS